MKISLIFSLNIIRLDIEEKNRYIQKLNKFMYKFYTVRYDFYKYEIFFFLILDILALNWNVFCFDMTHV